MAERLGTVYLVGAGPGDPGLLTCRARDLLVACDCVVHDYLVNPEILELVPATAVRHNVGKRGGATSITQPEINRTIVDLASRYRRIVRLKGGDPFLFGRGGEEAVALADAGIAFEVVPGVTSGTGVPAYAGIPVTHRAASSAVAFVTGHQQADSDDDLDWSSFARIETLVLYMGVHRLAENCAALIAAGRSADTPACAIQWGTYPHQRVVTATLATLAREVAAAGLGAPAITVIGEVVRYREKIRWFDHPLRRPLFGRRVVVTRSREQASGLAQALRALGATVIEFPLARYVAPASWRPLDDALANLSSYAWIAFTSANAIRFTWDRLRSLGRDARDLAGVKIGVIGAASAGALEAHGVRPNLIPRQATSEALADALIALERPASILLPQADNARPALAQRLAAAGWTVATAIAYRSEFEHPAIDLAVEPVDAVTFASSATAERFAAVCGAQTLAHLIASGCRFYAIGPQTAATMESLGLPVASCAVESSIDGLVEAVVADVSRRPF